MAEEKVVAAEVKLAKKEKKPVEPVSGVKSTGVKTGGVK